MMIISAAVLAHSGMYYCGRSHSETIREAVKTGETSFGCSTCGFLTHDGQFLNRRDAYLHTIECNQMLFMPPRDDPFFVLDSMNIRECDYNPELAQQICDEKNLLVPKPKLSVPMPPPMPQPNYAKIIRHFHKGDDII
jgi:hypothetical protein